ncbi:hypothetical protein G3I60_05415 [Streptomyces sp. SID13666]|uniref:hypothetical protein n=1 Tax=Streptomyces sp. SID13666 TaxID=2706054 RepID=UPI0013C255CA|nr:hypothetical protein [Streptomyces sp. SID13666]NEA53610.1 hypothetical protein [Streptomyces sp. SID13666]
MSRSAPRINRRHRFVQVERATVRDDGISFRALGVLTYLLDQAEEWQVRSDNLASGRKREGRDAIRKVLHELAASGYYRLERRRYLDGTNAMGTAISEYPVAQWVADYLTFGKKLEAPVIEQRDGTWLVVYPDGSHGVDGFTVEAAAPVMKPVNAAPAQKPPTASREAAGRKTPPAAVASAAAKHTKGVQQEEGESLAATAEQVAAWWWGDAERRMGAYVGAKGGYVGMRKMVQRALEKQYTARQCADALREAGQHFPSAQQWQKALSTVTGRQIPAARSGGRAAAYSDDATWGGSVPRLAQVPAPDEDDVQFAVVTT